MLKTPESNLLRLLEIWNRCSNLLLYKKFSEILSLDFIDINIEIYIVSDSNLCCEWALDRNVAFTDAKGENTYHWQFNGTWNWKVTIVL